MFPGIEAGNTFYKTMSLFGHARMAGMLCGTTAPVVLSSRADTGESKYASLALACVTAAMANKKRHRAMKILVINPGSTSTKMAIFDDDRQVWTAGAHHPVAELARFERISDQYAYRRDFILSRLQEAGIPLRFDAVIGRGGLLKPLSGGVYAVNERMRYDLVNATMEHACNLGALIAAEIASRCGCPALHGRPGGGRRDAPRGAHQRAAADGAALGVPRPQPKAVARRHAASVGRRYEDMNLIVAHLGGGISVGGALPWPRGRREQRPRRRSALSPPSAPARCPPCSSWSCASAGATR